ncbi:hypothetical protein ACWGFX_07650 [Streptomyces xanthophaeus]
MLTGTIDQPRRLPVQVSPRFGETTDSYIRRLARANHLKPSYLHEYLCGPPYWFGKPLLERLAAVSGRSPDALDRALADASSRRGRFKPTARYAKRFPFHGRRDLRYHIARDAYKGMPTRLLAQRYGVQRWVIHLALDTLQPLLPGTRRGADTIGSEVSDLLEGMIAAGLNTRQMWAELLDDHEYSISYGALAYHLRHTRSWQQRLTRA